MPVADYRTRHGILEEKYIMIIISEEVYQQVFSRADAFDAVQAVFAFATQWLLVSNDHHDGVSALRLPHRFRAD